MSPWPRRYCIQSKTWSDEGSGEWFGRRQPSKVTLGDQVFPSLRPSGVLAVLFEVRCLAREPRGCTSVRRPLETNLFRERLQDVRNGMFPLSLAHAEMYRRCYCRWSCPSAILADGSDVFWIHLALGASFPADLVWSREDHGGGACSNADVYWTPPCQDRVN